jgi:hypothetical protein
MPNYGTRSPYVGGSDMGETFGRFMLAMAQLKAQQKANEREQDYRESALDLRREELEIDRGLKSAQAEHWSTEAVVSMLKAKDLESRDERAVDAGLARFGEEMVGTEGYDPGKTSFLANTPANQTRLMQALRAKSLTESAALDPGASQNMLKPVEANKDTNVLDPTTGKTIGSGPVSPLPMTVLRPGERAYQGSQMTAENPATPMSDIGKWISLFNQSGKTVGSLSDDKGLGPAYTADPAGAGAVYTNNVALQQELGKRLLEYFQQQQAGEMPVPTNAPAGKSKYRLLKVEQPK